MDPTESKAYEAELIARGARRGFVKVQNVVLPFGRHVVPQVVYFGGHAWRPTMLTVVGVFGEDGEFACASIAFDVAWNRTVTTFILADRQRRIAEYPDGSALYECLLEGADALPPSAAIEHEDFRLRLFHHTTASALPLILESGHLRASSWNYMGSTELRDRHFVYLTDVREFRSGLDLRRVAMTDGGFTLAMRYDMPGLAPEVLNVPVRGRGQVSERLEFIVEPWLIETPPMLLHDSRVAGDGLARYWELCHPNIFRIPVRPGTVCALTESRIVTAREVPGWMDNNHVLAGTAFEVGSLRTVFDEERLEHLPVNIGRDDPDPCPFNRFLRTPQPPL